MKHLGVSSLMAGCLMWALLDAAPIPMGNRCKDKQKSNISIYDRPVFVSPQVNTLGIVKQGDNWVELEGEIPMDIMPMQLLKIQYGISYKADEKDAKFKEIHGTSLKDRKFTVLIENLDPQKQYVYRAYLTVIKQYTIYGEDKTFILDPSQWNDR